MKLNSKVAVFDIDGTIYDHETKEVSQTTINSFKRLKENGIKIGICTSRPYEETNNITDEVLELMDFVITSAGSRVTIDDEDVFIATIKPDYLKPIFEYCQKHDLMIRYSDSKRRGFFNKPQPKELEEWFNDAFGYVPTVKAYDQDEIVTMCVVAENVVDYIDDLKAMSPTSKHVLMQDVVFEITPSGIDKETALEFICDKYEISMDDIIAFGDGENDATMIKRAGFGVAMENGTDITKEASDFVTKSVSEEGVTFALKKFGLI